MGIALALLTALALQIDSGKPDPARCQTVVDDMGKVGFRISDAQSLAELTMAEFRRRQGGDAVVYEGFLVSSEALKKMLGPRSESQVTDDQIAYYKAAIANAKHRVRVRFGKKKKTHYVVVTCRKSGAEPADVLDKRELTGATFGEVREALVAALPTFCPTIAVTTTTAAPPSAAPAGEKAPDTRDGTPPQGASRKKREWVLPPKR